MTSAEIRQSFLDFFREKQHTIVPSSSLLPDAPNLLFTNAGMNQFVPIFLGQQQPQWRPSRVVDTQKCIRAGGKHNDLEDVGLDTYHHTFFEMLGNWSFGDYFKKEAIEWAWGLVVERWGLPAQRLYATVYQPGPGEPAEFDQEAYEHWTRLFREADLDPAVHVVNGNKTDNFWMMGDTGPCGPCSELHVDLTPEGDTSGSLVNQGDPRCIEIWNLVFIQFNANPGGTFTPLPQRHVDTGMGFERITAMIQGTRNFTDFSGVVSNYETDIFRPIFDEIEKLSGSKYHSTLPNSIGWGAHATSRAVSGDSPETGTSSPGSPTSARESRALREQVQIDIAFRVIADHIRTLSFAIADGILPSNEGRGYVLRRILRRAVRYGRTLGFHEPFFFRLVEVVADTMGDIFPSVREKREAVAQTIRREEESFNRTLDKGIELFEREVARLGSAGSLGTAGASPAASRASRDTFLPSESVGDEGVSGEARYIAGESRALPREQSTALPREQNARAPQIPGDFAFKLYDTYGFPLDLTELMSRERGLSVDIAEFERRMEEQRTRARAAQKKEDITVADETLSGRASEFLGYEFLEAEGVVETVFPAADKDELSIVLDRTPCYAEMGGQVGDEGLLHVPGHDRTEVGQLRVLDTQKRGNVFVHRSRLTDGRAPEPGEAVRVAVNVDRRQLIQGHHTVTHILHWALHELVSPEAAQKGSYVGPQKLTFDFSSAALTGDQKRSVENLVNEKVRENDLVSWTEIPYAEAKKRRDIQQFFGEKYGDVVRVVQIGGTPNQLNGYSMELCGGTHVRATGEIGAFRIVREEAIAAGIRRIEAVAGEAARSWAKTEGQKQQEKFDVLRRKKADLASISDFPDAGDTPALLEAIDRRAAQLDQLEGELRQQDKQQAKAGEAQLRSRAASIAKELAVEHATAPSLVAQVDNANGDLLQAIADALKGSFAGPIFLAGAANGSVALLASVPKELTAKFHAGKLIQQTAPLVGGKGGGRPDNARGGGKEVAKLSEALTKARELLSSS
jgi:alanyl-tRNA synthetase